MPQRKKNVSRMKQALNVAQDMSMLDQAATEQAKIDSQFRITLVLSQIKQRQEDTRDLNDAHVMALSESIAVLGLLEPLVVDRRNRLLAGGHRLAAIHLLQQIDDKAYHKQFPEDQVPVRVMPFDAEDDPERALQCEVAENEHRRDYTPKEVKTLADRLKKSGYRHTKGRPRKGQKALLPALEVIIGKHSRTIQRYLSGDDKSKKNTTNVAFSVEVKTLQRVQRDLEVWKKTHAQVVTGSKRTVLLKKIPAFIKLIDQVMLEVASENDESQI